MMNNNKKLFKKIIVTPAGRKKNLEILYFSLLSNKNEFDVWNIWVNTQNKEDVNYIEYLQEKNTWIKAIYLDPHIDEQFKEKFNMLKRIGYFFKTCNDPHAVYLRLDDDICYIHPKAIDSIISERILDNKTPILIGNIVNNAIISKIYQDNNIIDVEETISYNCLDEYGWYSPDFAIKIHNILLNKINTKSQESLFFDNQNVRDYARISINAISFRGDMHNLIWPGIINPVYSPFSQKYIIDEEQYLTTHISKTTNTPNIIIGNALFAHYSFFTQKTVLDQTDILQKYFDIAKNKVKII